MYELFEHTADLGLRARGDDLPAVFADTGRALYAAIVARPEKVRPHRQVQFVLSGEALDLLLFDWLAELLYRFDSEGFVGSEIELTLDDSGRLEAIVSGEPLDEARHGRAREVKAITYHGLRLEQGDDGGWLAEVIVDI